jgi:hypothetical protein
MQKELNSNKSHLKNINLARAIKKEEEELYSEIAIIKKSHLKGLNEGADEIDLSYSCICPKTSHIRDKKA